MRAAFRQRGFGLVFAGLLTSMLGDSLMLIVLAIWVKSLTGSNGAAGLTFFFMALPSLAAPVAGMFVDRAKRRTVLIWGNLAAAAGLTPLLFVRGAGQVWLIYVVAVLYGVSWVVLPAALNGLLKEMLPDELLVDANASLSTTKEALRLFGPLLGAGLYAWGGGAVVAVLDAATFVVAAASIAALRLRETTPVREDGHWRAELTAGLHHIYGDATLRHTLSAVAVALLVVGFLESAVFAAVQAFGRPPSFVGVVVSVQGVGAILGGLSSARMIRRLGEAPMVSVALVLLALGLAVGAASPWLTGFLLGTVVLGFALPPFIVALNTLLQRRTPQRLMGRVSAAADVLLGTPQAGSIALGALLVTVLSYRSIFWLSAAVILAAAAYLTWALHRESARAPLVLASDPTDDGEIGEAAALPAVSVAPRAQIAESTDTGTSHGSRR